MKHKNKRTNVLVVGVSSKIGGVETIVKNLYDNINNENIQFDYLVFNEKCAFEDYFILNNSKVFHITSKRKSLMKNIMQLKKFFRHTGQFYDYIWINLSSASNIQVYKYVKKYTNAKIISHSHSTNIESNTKFINIIYKFLHKKNQNKLNLFTDYYVACSEESGVWLYGKKNKERIFVIQNGIDVEKYKFNLNIRNELRERLNLVNSYVIGHIGRFSKVKNHSFLIDIFKEIKELKSNSILLLIGEGECLIEIEQKVKSLGLSEDVLFMGFRENIPDFLSAIDCILLPSFFEGSPVVVAEALASGLNCVISSNIKEKFDNSPLVKYMPIDVHPSKWAEIVVNMKACDNRESYNDSIRKSKFNIKFSSKKLISLIK